MPAKTSARFRKIPAVAPHVDVAAGDMASPVAQRGKFSTMIIVCRVAPVVIRAIRACLGFAFRLAIMVVRTAMTKYLCLNARKAIIATSEIPTIAKLIKPAMGNVLKAWLIPLNQDNANSAARAVSS